MANTGFEGGTQGANVTTLSEPTLAGVTNAGATSITYDNTQKAHGGFSALFTHSSTNSFHVDRNLDGGSGTTLYTDAYGRIYIYLASNPTGNLRFMRFLNGTTEIGRAQITTGGKVALLDAGNTTLWTSTNSVTLNAWNRLEVHTNSPAAGTGYMEAELFLGANLDGSTADETSGTHSSAGITLGGTGTITVGQTTSTNPGVDWWMDDFDLSSTAWLGAYATSTTPTTSDGFHFADSSAVSGSNTNVNTTDTLTVDDTPTDILIDEGPDLTYTDVVALVATFTSTDAFAYTESASTSTGPTTLDTYAFADLSQVTVLGTSPTSSDLAVLTDTSVLTTSTSPSGFDGFSFTDVSMVIEASFDHPGQAVVTIISPRGNVTIEETI